MAFASQLYRYFFLSEFLGCTCAVNMESGSDHLKTPFLLDNGEHSSVTSLKCDFFSKLPDKVRSGLDPELSFSIDFSKATGLTKGILESSLCMQFQVIIAFSKSAHSLFFIVFFL